MFGIVSLACGFLIEGAILLSAGIIAFLVMAVFAGIDTYKRDEEIKSIKDELTQVESDLNKTELELKQLLNERPNNAPCEENLTPSSSSLESTRGLSLFSSKDSTQKKENNIQDINVKSDQLATTDSMLNCTG